MKNKIIRIGLISLIGLSSISCFTNLKLTNNIQKVEAVGVSSYWDSWISSNSSVIANGGTSFLTSLQEKISENYNEISYDGLKTAYKDSDPVPGSNGAYIWDIYGGNTYEFVSSMASSYTKNGDGYNREHSVPKSWFNEAKPAYSDLVHVIPADGYINSRRNNYAFGEVSDANYNFEYDAPYYNGVKYANSGSTKIGSPKSINGANVSTSHVCEPDDQYKGDIARIYMYFATKYGGTSCAATTDEGGLIFSSTLTNSNPYFTNYGLALIQKWHVLDPVSQKEIDRNNAIESLQGNRNPFVDYPEWADKIFHTSYESNGGTGGEEDTDPVVDSVIISPSSISLDLNGTKTATLNVTVNASNGASKDVIWATNSDVVSIDQNGQITALKVGEAEVRATSTFNNAKFGVCNVTVKDSSGGGSTPSVDENGTPCTISVGENATAATVNSQDAIKVGTSKAGGSMTITIPKGTVKVKLYAAGWNNSDPNSVTVKQSETTIGTLTLKIDIGIANNSPFTLEQDEENYLQEISLSNIASDTTLTLEGSKRFVVWNVMAYGEKETTNEPVSLILDTSNVKKEYYINDTFSASGLIVYLMYTNSEKIEVTPSNISTPDMSTAGSKEVVVTYVLNDKTFNSTYEIQVLNKPEVTYSVTVDKTFYVGDVISKFDIKVIDNNDNVITDFEFSDYQFKYSDALSGGTLTTKQFDLNINGKNVVLNTQVQRKEHVLVENVLSVTDTITSTDLAATTTVYTDFNNVKKDSGATYAGQSAKNSQGHIQLRSSGSNSGIVSTTSGGIIESVSIEVGSGEKRIDVYGSNKPYESASNLYATGSDNTVGQGTLIGSLTSSGTITFTEDYAYVGIRSYSGAIYLESVSITYKGSENNDTAVNFANYIMFEDTLNQCTTKYEIACGYFENLPSSERKLFMTDNSYVIKEARNRFEAWANYFNEEIKFNEIDYEIAEKNTKYLILDSYSDNSLIMICSLLFAGAILIGVIYKKRLYKNK